MQAQELASLKMAEATKLLVNSCDHRDTVRCNDYRSLDQETETTQSFEFSRGLWEPLRACFPIEDHRRRGAQRCYAHRAPSSKLLTRVMQ